MFVFVIFTENAYPALKQSSMLVLRVWVLELRVLGFKFRGQGLRVYGWFSVFKVSAVVVRSSANTLGQSSNPRMNQNGVLSNQ